MIHVGKLWTNNFQHQNVFDELLRLCAKKEVGAAQKSANDLEDLKQLLLHEFLLATFCFGTAEKHPSKNILIICLINLQTSKCKSNVAWSYSAACICFGMKKLHATLGKLLLGDHLTVQEKETCNQKASNAVADWKRQTTR